MTGRLYDDRDRDTVFDVEHDVWLAESRWELEPNVVTAGTGRGDAHDAGEWATAVIAIPDLGDDALDLGGAA